MVRRHGQLLLFTLAVLLTVQCFGTACAEDRMSDRSGGPCHAHDQLPGGTEGLTETEDGEDTVESEFVPVQGSPLPINLHATPWCAGRSSLLRETFDSDLFRPPTLSCA